MRETIWKVQVRNRADLNHSEQVWTTSFRTNNQGRNSRKRRFSEFEEAPLAACGFAYWAAEADNFDASDKLSPLRRNLRLDIMEQYKAYLQDIGNIGVRHENSRRFYLAAPSALFAFLALAGKDGPLKIAGPALVLVGIVGIVLCIVWLMHMQAFRAIYLAKFNVLRKMEEKGCLYPIFKEEWEGFEESQEHSREQWKGLKNDRRYKLSAWIDWAIPTIFLILFAVLLFLK